MRAAWIAGALVTLVAAPVAAQRGGGGGANADFGGRPNYGEEVGRRFESMGDLKTVLEKITLTREQKDTLDKIESNYRSIFRLSGRMARDLFSRGRPSMDDLDKIKDDAEIQRNTEWAEVTKLLTEAQLPLFQQNVEKVKAEEARRDADMRARMPRGGRP